jgi:hypothetical protein
VYSLATDGAAPSPGARRIETCTTTTSCFGQQVDQTT